MSEVDVRADTDTPPPNQQAEEASEAQAKRKVTVVDVAMDSEEDEEDEEENNYLKVSKPLLDNTSDWQQVRAGIEAAAVLPDVKVDAGKLPLDTVDGEEVLHFYWLDAYEPNRGNGTIYLFGKVFVEEASSFVSCCLTVNNLERNVFVVPRDTRLDDQGNPTMEEVGLADVHEEFAQILAKNRITTYMCKPVTRKYAFEKTDVPTEATVLKCKYSAAFPALPGDVSGRTFSHVFGTNIMPLERFLMKRDLMGPCWLQVKGAKPNTKTISWCKIEAVCDDPKLISKVQDPPAAPPLTVLTLSMQTILNRKSHVHEILAISGLVHQQVNVDGHTPNVERGYAHFTAIRKLANNPFPFDLRPKLQPAKRSVEAMPSERALLGFVLAKIQKVDPDVVVGHNIYGFDLDVLVHRLKTHNVPHWSRIGRLRRNHMPNLKS
jgi:DNA polymerase alpha subunit A